MKLYHGSNVKVLEPKLLEIQRSLDFGKGFYTTSDLEQAKKWAIRTQRVRKTSKSFVSVYEFDKTKEKELKILSFSKPDEQWLKFVVQNRRGQVTDNEYDLIFGPVANDQTTQTIILFLDGYLSEQSAIEQLLPQNLKDQYVFKTQKALECLKCIEVIEL